MGASQHRTIVDDAGEQCAQTFAWWLHETGLFDEVSEAQCEALANAFSAGWVLAHTRARANGDHACTCDPGPEGQHQWHCGLRPDDASLS